MLALASIFFYGYWSLRYVALLLVSILMNFGAGSAILRYRSARQGTRAKSMLVVALAGNLIALGYFKYANFIVDSINSVASNGLLLPKIILPIGISSFTFTQIAFLVDTYSGKVREQGIVPCALFVTFFPHLIAGPSSMQLGSDLRTARDDVARLGPRCYHSAPSSHAMASAAHDRGMFGRHTHPIEYVAHGSTLRVARPAPTRTLSETVSTSECRTGSYQDSAFRPQPRRRKGTAQRQLGAAGQYC